MVLCSYFYYVVVVGVLLCYFYVVSWELGGVLSENWAKFVSPMLSCSSTLTWKNPKKEKKEKKSRSYFSYFTLLIRSMLHTITTSLLQLPALEKKLMIRFGTTSTTVVVAYGCIWCLVFGSTLLLWQIGKYNVFQLRWKLQSKIHQLCYYFLSLSRE